MERYRRAEKFVAGITERVGLTLKVGIAVPSSLQLNEMIEQHDVLAAKFREAKLFKGTIRHAAFVLKSAGGLLHESALLGLLRDKIPGIRNVPISRRVRKWRASLAKPRWNRAASDVRDSARGV